MPIKRVTPGVGAAIPEGGRSITEIHLLDSQTSDRSMLGCAACGLKHRVRLYVGDYMSIKLCDYCAPVLVAAVSIGRLKGEL